MHALIVRILVKPDGIDAFLEATAANHAGSVAEPGCLRFDVLRDAEDPRRFYLYEVYASPAAIEAHRASPHYVAWNTAVADLMAEPRSRDRATVVLPEPWA